MFNRLLDLIPKFLGIFTSILIILGIISSVIFYRAFSINILEYITIGESILLFISKFTALSISLVSGYLLSALFLERHDLDVEPREISKEQLKALSLNKWQKIYLLFIILPLLLLSIMGFSPFAFWTLPFSLVVRLYVMSYIIKRLRLVFKHKQIATQLVDYIQMSFLTLIFLATIAMVEVYLVYNAIGGKKVILYYPSGKTLKTDTNTLYLGKSQLYYYLYDKSNGKAIIIKSEQIEKLEINQVDNQ